MTTCRNIFTIFKRELKSYFESPVAYVFLISFLVLANALTFLWPAFPYYERGAADFEPFFLWVPIVYLLLVPASTMGLWAEERRSGTIELLLTMPVTMTQAILGKFLAAWVFMVIAVALTFPIVATSHYLALGNIDAGAVTGGYLGLVLLAGTYVSVGLLTSSMTRSQVISFVISLIICLLLVLAGTPFITGLFANWAPSWLVNGVAACSFLPHFESMKRGVVDVRDIAYYVSVTVFMIFATHVVLENRKSA